MLSKKKDCYLSNVKIMHEEIKLFRSSHPLSLRLFFIFFNYTIFLSSITLIIKKKIKITKTILAL